MAIMEAQRRGQHIWLHDRPAPDKCVLCRSMCGANTCPGAARTHPGGAASVQGAYPGGGTT
jgi:hypothetical protein